MFNFLKKTGEKNSKDLEEMLKKGFLSKEEFLRFTIVRKKISLEKAEIELKNFLRKQK